MTLASLGENSVGEPLLSCTRKGLSSQSSGKKSTHPGHPICDNCRERVHSHLKMQNDKIVVFENYLVALS